MNKQRILITVKTYPTLSRKYGETVCTAGVHEDGSWVRIYPVPFRRLGEKEQYRKFDWLECRLVRNLTDPRPETFRPVDEHELYPVAHVDTADNWRERRRILLKTARVYDQLDDLRNCLRSVEGDEPKALAKVRQKYFDEFLQKDLHFFLGTTQQFHFVAPNPWVIIGVFPIPHQKQLGLFG